MKKNIMFLVLLLAVTQQAFAKNYSVAVDGPVNDLAKSKIEAALGDKFGKQNVTNLKLDAFARTISFDGPENLKIEDVKSTLTGAGFPAKK